MVLVQKRGNITVIFYKPPSVILHLHQQLYARELHLPLNGGELAGSVLLLPKFGTDASGIN